MPNAAFTRWNLTRRRVAAGMSTSEWRDVCDIRFAVEPLLSMTTVRKHVNDLVMNGKAVSRRGRYGRREYLLRVAAR